MIANIDFPFHFDHRGRTAASPSDDKHIRDMIEELLFTAPGERVNRPDFGCGLLGLCFEGNSAAMAGAVQSTVQASLIRWLGDVIDVQAVQAQSEDATLTVTVAYAVKRTGQRSVQRFVQGPSGNVES
jgi:hypothetical protein